ncbi:peptide-methionine (S)-S-oxide reductase MsrA [Zavarzinella formosa]|uniref:peptide-methionine (S)-S-oxide reductase MsrA n=1 Tax=Zavarzinella formosa TaxID=360055 RepID=UPI0002D80920|nr:peptide-methionine (S)-S-oxide reductase MsrA [Zavarzinella formosa]
MATEQTTLGGGCFWCLEAVFEQAKGIIKSVSGYTGGTIPLPTYRQVCGGHTGHAEVVQLTFDPEIISFEQLLGIFFAIHDPTTKDRQGADVGTQYRSAIFYQSNAQKTTAERVIQEMTRENVFDASIVTEVSPLSVFYLAEEYHQGYFRNNPTQPYCQMVVMPKVEKFFHKFGAGLAK